MKRKLLIMAGAFIQVAAFAQGTNQSDIPEEVYSKEDTTLVTTIDEIVNTQQRVSSVYYKQRRSEKVWGYRGYLNIGYNSSHLTPKTQIITGVPNDVLVSEMQSDWGISLKYGRNYRLHKRAISDVLQFNLDFSFIDLTVNHYKAEGERDLYDSRFMFPDSRGDSVYIIPWNLEKYEFNYGISIGPSLTVAPFTFLNNRNFHFIKLNLYYHIGYQASLLLIKGDDDMDANPARQATQNGISAYNPSDILAFNDVSGSNILFGHGIMSSFGMSLSWKSIGIGYEHKISTLNYKSANTSKFGHDKYKFKESSNRFYVQYRF